MLSSSASGNFDALRQLKALSRLEHCEGRLLRFVGAPGAGAEAHEGRAEGRAAGLAEEALEPEEALLLEVR